MHTDAEDLPAESLIEGDLCIVGAGAAGITMALEWAGSNTRVVLLEGGGFDYDRQMQDLYRGNQNQGERYFPLEAARLHYFGGTTGHWAGFCSPFDDIDFQVRPWVPHSGWPFDRQALDPYYARAHPILELGPYQYDAAYWEAEFAEFQTLSLGENFWTKIWQFSPPTRFGTRYRDSVLTARNISLYTHANVVELKADSSVSTISRLRVRTPGGKYLSVQCRRYVLACGAIQNTRLLLVSNSQAPAGLGNDRDLVGRYFMEHLEMPGANLLLQDAQQLKLYASPEYFSGVPVPARGELALSPAIQTEKGLLHGTAEIQPGFHSTNLRSSFQISTPARLYERFHQAPDESLIRYVYDRIRWRLFPDQEPLPSPGREFHLSSRQEQAPNPDSRVTVDFADRDAMGMPRVNLNWRLTEQDKYSIRGFYELLGSAVGQTGLGRVQLLDWLLGEVDSDWPDFLSGGWHHMGTLRMHESSSQGVVDANCRVHGLDNLYIAGSAVFPTSGAANPTLTLVALALRLSDHLKSLA